MPTTNVVADFPADQFTLFGHCNACGYSAPIPRAHLPETLPIPAIAPRLRCGACGARDGEVWIVYMAGPVFRHRGTTNSA
jgi:hypothetical protein